MVGFTPAYNRILFAEHASEIKLYRVNLTRVNFIGVTTKSRRGDTTFGIPSGCCFIRFQVGMVICLESCMGWKSHKLEGCRASTEFD